MGERGEAALVHTPKEIQLQLLLRVNQAVEATLRALRADDPETATSSGSSSDQSSIECAGDLTCNRRCCAQFCGPFDGQKILLSCMTCAVS